MGQKSLVNIYEAKTTLSSLIEAVLAGKEVTIAKAGKPLVDLIPHRSKQAKKRKLGVLNGKVKMAADFDATPLDLVARMRGEQE